MRLAMLLGTMLCIRMTSEWYLKLAWIQGDNLGLQNPFQLVFGLILRLICNKSGGHFSPFEATSLKIMIWAGFLEIWMDLMLSGVTLSLVLMMNMLVLLLMMGLMVNHLSSEDRLRGIFSSNWSGFVSI